MSSPAVSRLSSPPVPYANSPLNSRIAYGSAVAPGIGNGFQPPTQEQLYSQSLQHGDVKALSPPSSTTQLHPSLLGPQISDAKAAALSAHIAAANQLQASHSMGSAYSAGASASSYGFERTLSNQTTTTVQSEYEATRNGKVINGGIGEVLLHPEAEFARLMTEVPWMRFQVSATPDISWLHEERIKLIFEQLYRKNARATTIQVVQRMRTEINEVFERILQSEEEVNLSTIVQDVQAQFELGAVRAAFTPAHALALSGHSKASPPDLSHAHWIWTKEAAGAKSPPAGARPFRKCLNLSEFVDSVTIDITSDNYDTLYINGKLVGSTALGGTEWQHARRYTVRFEATKQVVIAVWAEQSTSLGPAGLAVAGVAWNSLHAQPNSYYFNTDSTWKTLSKSISGHDFVVALAAQYNDQAWEEIFGEGTFDLATPWSGKVFKPTQESKWSDRLTNIPGNDDAPGAPPATVL